LLDAESDHPVPNATIGIAYQGMGGMIPENVSGATDLNGLLDLRVARDNFAYIGIEADGYLRDPTNPELLDPPDKIELRVYRLPCRITSWSCPRERGVCLRRGSPVEIPRGSELQESRLSMGSARTARA
jgi:hypothetical protein